MSERPADERVLGIVERNACGTGPPVVGKDEVLLRLTQSDVDPEAAESALRSALNSGRLERVGGGYRPPGGCDC